LVGFKGSDDAGIYKLTDEIAVITTADYITPPVDDPFTFGQIAAANAISDVYAMGGKPITCLNLVNFPPDKLDPEILHQIILGALDKITEAGAVLAGGHSVEDEEPKFGLAVTGVVHPEKFWSNSGAKAGDVLILTKPVGSGVLFNANLKGWVSDAAMSECIAVISTLNKTAAEVMSEFDIHAATDVTGFGLAGHGYEMANGSGVCLEVEIDKIPVMKDALEMYEKGMSTGVNKVNRELVEHATRFLRELPPWHKEIVFDPQTSGGLLVAIPENQADSLCQTLIDKGVTQASIIGKVIECEQKTHLVFK